MSILLNKDQSNKSNKEVIEELKAYYTKEKHLNELVNKLELNMKISEFELFELKTAFNNLNILSERLYKLDYNSDFRQASLYLAEKADKIKELLDIKEEYIEDCLYEHREEVKSKVEKQDNFKIEEILSDYIKNRAVNLIIRTLMLIAFMFIISITGRWMRLESADLVESESNIIESESNIIESETVEDAELFNPENMKPDLVKLNSVFISLYTIVGLIIKILLSMIITLTLVELAMDLLVITHPYLLKNEFIKLSLVSDYAQQLVEKINNNKEDKTCV